MKSRTLQVTFLALFLITSCNKEDYYGTSLEIQGADAACSAGKDIQSCEAIPGCQVGLEDVESENLIFASCVANPPAEELAVTPPEPEKPVIEEPVVLPPVEEKVPTLKEVYETDCEKLDEKYLLIKKYKTAEGEEKISKKVKVCHRACPKKGPHTIIIACPALKSHIKHHEDEIGACPVE